MMFDQRKMLSIAKKNVGKADKKEFKRNVAEIKREIILAAKHGETSKFLIRLSDAEIKWLEKRGFLVTKVTAHGYDVEW